MKPILDACCGSKMFWFDKQNPHVEFCDIREVPRHEFYLQRYIEISPDTERLSQAQGVCADKLLEHARRGFAARVLVAGA